MKKLFLLVILFTTVVVQAQKGDGDVFTIEPESGKCPLLVTFTDVSEEFVGWDWNFGDDSPHGTTNPCMHPYTSKGDYLVVLTGTTPGGSKHFFTGHVVVSQGTIGILEYTVSYNCKYEVYDVTGRFIGNNIQSLKNGIYFIKQKIDDKYLTKKIMILNK